MKRKFQKIHTYTFDNRSEAGECTEKSSFSTLEKAIEDAEFWIRKSEPWMDTTVIHIEIVDKETKEVLWTYKAQ